MLLVESLMRGKLLVALILFNDRDTVNRISSIARIALISREPLCAEVSVGRPVCYRVAVR